MMDEMIDEHFTVTVGQGLRPGQNRYRLECGWYIDCGCYHRIGSLAYCLNHGIHEKVTYSAITKWNPDVSKWQLTYEHPEKESE
jgi:hypothetical protein